MLSLNTYTEHNKIDNYLRRRSIQIQQNKEVINHENKLSNFPIGLIIISKDEQPIYEEKIEFINYYACQLFQIKENTNIKKLKSKFEEYIRLKENNNKKETCTLNDLIFNSPVFSFEIENFFPFQSKHSKNIILYIKINNIQNQKYIVIDKYDKYIEEQKYIEFNLIKNINYQYLHTLYHELNNPLNALLALSGENSNFNATEINSKDCYKPSLMKRKTIKSNNKKAYKKEKKQSGLVSMDNIKNKIDDNGNEYKPRKKSLFENDSSEVSSRINLLVKIIKIFIKNFILYLKTRADNLLTLKKEFNLQNEASDIINAVEVSDYEQDLTKNKSCKINLEYILDLYFHKYLCLFKYKEIEYNTNFSELSNIFVITDDFNFSYYIRQIYTYLYYVVPKKEGFYFEHKFIDNGSKIEITIKKKINGTISKTTDDPCDLTMNQLIQTKEMTKEVLYGITKKLGFEIKIFDNDDKDQSSYLSIILPIIKKDKLTEEDEFKDEDINEKIGKNYLLLEEKLKRQFPSSGGAERKNSNVSTIHIADMISKNGDEKRDTSESFISFPKNINLKNENNVSNCNSNINTNNNIGNTSNNFISNENQKKYITLYSTPSCDSFLSKCLKISENKKSEKSKFKKNPLNIKLIKNKINNHSSDKNIFINITNINNSPKKLNYNDKSFDALKRIINKNNEKLFKNKGIFTIINNYGLSEEMDFYDNDMVSDISNTTQKNKKYQITFKGLSPNPSMKSKSRKTNGRNINNTINKTGSNNDNNSDCQIDLFRRVSEDKNTNSVKTGFFGKRNASRSNFKSSVFISEINGENEEKSKNNININKSNVLKDLTKTEKVGVKIEYVKDIEKKKENPKQVNQKNLILSEIEEDPGKKRKLSQNINPPSRNSKEAMTFFDKRKLNMSKDNNTMIDDSINENKNLFMEANDDRKSALQKSKNSGLNVSKSSEFSDEIKEDEKEDVENEEKEENEEDSENKESKESKESCEESDEKEENEDNEENEEGQTPSEEKCNCADLLVVDDEEFNVMASQRMLKNLGYFSDKAYNGQECIDLINEKKNSNCKCGKNYYKIIFLDIVMPIMDGIKTAHKVQEMIDNKEINEEVKIVFISGNIDGADLEKSLLEIKCVKECLQKPVMIAKYQKILEKYYSNN